MFMSPHTCHNSNLVLYFSFKQLHKCISWNNTSTGLLISLFSFLFHNDVPGYYSMELMYTLTTLNLGKGLGLLFLASRFHESADRLEVQHNNYLK